MKDKNILFRDFRLKCTILCNCNKNAEWRISGTGILGNAIAGFERIPACETFANYVEMIARESGWDFKREKI
jgi:hypothetical protein